MTVPILYTAELDLAESDLPAFSEWFANRHAADLYEAGMQVCSCYRAVEGGLAIIDIYEAASWSVFAGEAYGAIGVRDPYGPEILARRMNKAHTVYANSTGLPRGAGGPFRADWVALARFDATAEAEDTLRQALAHGAAEPLLAGGARRLRLVARTTDHPRNPTFRPRLMLLAEWDAQPSREAALDRWVDAQLGYTPASLDVFIGDRLYPWRDRR